MIKHTSDIIDVHVSYGRYRPSYEVNTGQRSTIKSTLLIQHFSKQQDQMAIKTSTGESQNKLIHFLIHNIKKKIHLKFRTNSLSFHFFYLMFKKRENNRFPEWRDWSLQFQSINSINQYFHPSNCLHLLTHCFKWLTFYLFPLTEDAPCSVWL